MKTVILIIVVIVILTALVQLPDIEINKEGALSSNVFTYIRAAMYFIPSGTAFTICGIMLSLWVFRVIIAFVRVIKDINPFS